MIALFVRTIQQEPYWLRLSIAIFFAINNKTPDQQTLVGFYSGTLVTEYG